jgi:hypothetical protein
MEQPKSKQANSAAQKNGLAMVIPVIALSPVARAEPNGRKSVSIRKQMVPITKKPVPSIAPLKIHMRGSPWRQYRV